MPRDGPRWQLTCRFLIRDRDTKFSRSFDEVVRSDRARVIVTPFRAPTSVAAVSFYLIPILGVAGSFLFLGERLDPSQWIGVAIVLVAVAVIIRRTGATALQPHEVGLAQAAGRR